MLKYRNGILITWVAFVLFLMTLWFVNPDEEIGNLEVDLNGYHIRLNFPVPTYVGENEFQVHLFDLDTTPLNNSKVTIMAAPILQTDENEASIEKKPMNMAGHYMLNVLDEDLPNSASSGVTSSTVGNPTVDPISGNNETHPAEHILVALQQSAFNAGEYEGVVSFPQSGHWILVVDFNGKGKSLKAEFPMHISPNKPVSYKIIAGFFVLSALLIGAVAVTRRETKAI